MLQNYQNSKNVQPVFIHQSVVIDDWWTTMKPNQSTIEQTLTGQNIKPASFKETAENPLEIKITMVNDWLKQHWWYWFCFRRMLRSRQRMLRGPQHQQNRLCKLSAIYSTEVICNRLQFLFKYPFLVTLWFLFFNKVFIALNLSYAA